MAISSEIFAEGIRVIAEQTVTGFAYPESVANDPQDKVLYVSEFGSELKPTQKDGKGGSSRVSLTGKVLEAQFPPPSGTILDKPKAIWVEGNRPWVTDIDVVGVFDIKIRKGRKVELPGIKFCSGQIGLERHPCQLKKNSQGLEPKERFLNLLPESEDRRQDRDGPTDQRNADHAMQPVPVRRQPLGEDVRGQSGDPPQVHHAAVEKKGHQHPAAANTEGGVLETHS